LGYFDLQLRGVSRAKHLLSWHAPTLGLPFNSTSHRSWMLRLEGSVSKHPGAQALQSVCQLLSPGQPVRDFDFTMCRASSYGTLFGRPTHSLQQCLISVAFSVSLYYSLQARLADGVLASLLAWYLEDFNSGIVHIVLDNPSTLKWPAFHGCALGFQNHHDYPTDSLDFPYNEAWACLWLSLHSFAFLSASLLAYLFNKDDRRSLHWACIIVAVRIETTPRSMDFHGWAHKDLKELPVLVQWAIRWNLALSETNHLGHHPSYKQDFAVINGWSHPALNYLLRTWRDQNSEDWMVALLASQLLPAFLIFGHLLLDKIGIRQKKIAEKVI